MKIRQKRVLAYVLAMVMVLNLCAVPARADEGNTSGSSSPASDNSSESNTHTHSWKYELTKTAIENDTIKAACVSTSCAISPVTIQLGNKDVTYDGSEHPVEIVATKGSGVNSTPITATDDSSVKAQLKAMGIKLKIQYQKKNTNGKYDDLDAGKCPKDAGTYKVVASVEQSSSGSEETVMLLVMLLLINSF